MEINVDTVLSGATLLGLAALFWRMTRDLRDASERHSQDMRDMSERHSRDMRELAGRVSRLEGLLEGLLHRNSAPKAPGE
ncbi:MAG: hypothetical protein F4Y03_08180 [Alphaproteobacteria bacterium]|nr:hypothetical protein [Alphaproteobacteria bacterium]